MASLINSNKNVVLVNNDVTVNSNSPPFRNMNTKVRYSDESLRIIWPSFGLNLASPTHSLCLHDLFWGEFSLPLPHRKN